MKGSILLESYRKELARTEKQREACRNLGQKTTKLKNRCRGYRDAISNLERTVEEIDKLKLYTYYSVELAINNSCSHKAIMYVGYSVDDILIFNHSYEERYKRCSIEALHHLKILRELDEINMY